MEGAELSEAFDAYMTAYGEIRPGESLTDGKGILYRLMSTVPVGGGFIRFMFMSEKSQKYAMLYDHPNMEGSFIPDPESRFGAAE